MSSTNGTPEYRTTYGRYTPPAGPTEQQLQARANGKTPIYVLYGLSGGATNLGSFPSIEAAEAKLPPFVAIAGGVRVEVGEHVLYVSPKDRCTVWYAIERGYRS